VKSITKTTNWYRQPLVWMLIFIPLSAVLGGIAMIYLAITTDDGLVNDDYYRLGKEINLVIERDIAAKQLGLEAEFNITSENNSVQVELTGASFSLPKSVNLSLLHATRANHDQHISLTLTPSNSYHGLVEKLVPGKWYIQLHTEKWRLSSELAYPKQHSAKLSPK